MQWISTKGGPLVVLPRRLAIGWNGASPERRDYDQACSVQDYLGVVPWEGRQILVLGDEPFQATTWMQAPRIGILRWMYAPSEQALLQCLEPSIWEQPIEEARWEAVEAEHVLIDSGLRGTAATEVLQLALTPGDYRIATYLVKPSEDVAGLVHAFDAAPRSIRSIDKK